MFTTSVGALFMAGGVGWALCCVLIGGMTEYRATWRDIPCQFIFGVPVVLLGAALVWREPVVTIPTLAQSSNRDARYTTKHHDPLGSNL